MTIKKFTCHMKTCLSEAKTAYLKNEVPVGAAIIKNGRVIAATHNQMVEKQDATMHAEMLAIQLASQVLQTRFLSECDIYVTLEPCPMCAQAIANARLRRLYYGAEDTKSGGVQNGPTIYKYSSYTPEVYSGFTSRECSKILVDFFRKIRNAA